MENEIARPCQEEKVELSNASKARIEMALTDATAGLIARMSFFASTIASINESLVVEVATRVKRLLEENKQT